jgi:hypothetical protein
VLARPVATIIGDREQIVALPSERKVTQGDAHYVLNHLQGLGDRAPIEDQFDAPAQALRAVFRDHRRCGGVLASSEDDVRCCQSNL